MKKNDERYDRCIDLYLEGKGITEINKITGVSRQTIYNLLDDDYYKAIVDERRREIRIAGQNRLENKLGKYVDELENIALTSDNENTRKDCLFYLINRILGTPTNKVQDITEDKSNDSNKVEDIDNVLNKYKTTNIDNVIDIDTIVSSK